MLAVPLIVHHKKDKRLRAGIVVDQQIVMQPSPLNPNQVSPVVLCSVVWDESVIEEATGEITVPEDDKRLDAICLHSANELVFDGPYRLNEVDYDDEEEEEEGEEEIANADFEADANVDQAQV